MASNNTSHRLALPSGSVIGSYRIRNVLGEGSFGITYLADHNTLGRQVALKELLPADIAIRATNGEVVARNVDMDGEMDWACERFITEAQNIAKCKHPNIIEVFDVFQANGTAYMATSYEPGENMEMWLKHLGRAPSDEEVRGIVLPLLDGLGCVHANNLLHRDIKPENIYLCRDGRPVLLDFGAARETVSSRSRPVTTLLTPGYAPYEQYASDDAGQLGPWTDIYAFGATTYRMMAGTKPVEASRRIRNDPYTPVVELLKGKYSEPLLAAVDWSLQVMETDRPQNTGALRAVLTGKTPSSTIRKKAPPPPPDDGGKTIKADGGKTHSGRAGLWIGIIAVLVAGLSVAVLNEHFEERAKQLKTESEERERRLREENDRRFKEMQKSIADNNSNKPSAPSTSSSTAYIPPPRPSEPTPPPAPATTPTPRPVDYTQEYKDLATKFYTLGNSSSGREERNAMFASVCSYHEDGNLTPSEIRDKQKDYDARWLNQTYNVSSVEISFYSGKTVATVPFSFEASNEVEKATGRRIGHVTFDSSKKVTSVSSETVGEDPPLRIDTDAQVKVMLNFLRLYYNAGDSQNPGKFEQTDYIAKSDVYPYCGVDLPSGTKTYSRYLIQSDTDKYKRENPIRDFEMGDDWRVISRSFDDKEVTLQGSFTLQKGSGSPLHLTDRVKIRMAMGSSLRLRGVSMEIIGIGAPDVW